MGRLNRGMLGGGLALIVAATGCRSPRSDVPPGPPIAKESTLPEPVGFGSDPHANNLPPINQAGFGTNQGSATNPFNTPGAGTPPGTFGGNPSRMAMPSRPNLSTAPAQAPAAGASQPPSMSNIPDEGNMPPINP